tara:strand:- start:106 stop:1584 length:1479 start_codon:yes stop_codon:yes gene_type:complete
MMALDEAKFRATAKAAGYSDDEINAELNTSTVAAAAPPPTMQETFSDSSAKLKANYDEKVRKALTSEVKVGDNTFEIPSFFTSPAGIITAASAGIGLASTLFGAAKVTPKVYNAIKDRWISKAPAIDRTVDIPLDSPTATLNAKAQTPPVVIPAEYESLLAKSEQAKADKLRYEQERQALAAAKLNTPVVEAPVVGAMPDGAPAAPVSPPIAPVAPVQSIAAAPIEVPPQVAPTATQTLAAGGTPNQVVTQIAAQEIDAIKPVAPPTAPAAPTELRTGTGKIAYAGQGPEPKIGKKGPQFRNEYQSLEAIPKGYALVPNAQYIDPIRNDIGQAAFTKAFTGREFPQTYEEAIAVSKDINRSLGRATREETKAAGLPPAETTKGIAKTTTENKKLVKIIGQAGLAGALVSLADLALAKTPEEKANAGVNLLGAVLPPGMDINAAGAPTLPQSQVNNAYLLGSPYAQTEAAKTYRLRERAGAGRGIAPPSAYFR